MDLISVIVPIYKVEKYINSCVESIVNQTYKNTEIILVDDGSPDNCPRICDEWAKKDSRIRVIHKENGGSAQARNMALDIARGDYIAFADSDDIMNHNMLEILHNVAIDQKADIVECDFSIDEKKALIKEIAVGVIDIYGSQTAMLEHVNDKIFRQVIWNKLYKAEIIEQVRFVEDKIIDDEFWTYKAIGNATTLAHVAAILYFYRQQEDSVMHQHYSLKRLASIEAHVERHEFIKKKFPQLYVRSLTQIWFDCRYHGQMALLHLDGGDKAKAFIYLHHVISNYPLSLKYIFYQQPVEIVWLMLEKISLKNVCKLRNALRRGL